VSFAVESMVDPETGREMVEETKGVEGSGDISARPLNDPGKEFQRCGAA
jgi:hypothetical protein